MPKLKLRQAILATQAWIARIKQRTARAASARSEHAHGPQEDRSLPATDEEFEKFLARKTTIVCVDGDPISLEHVRSILSAADFETITLSSLSTALDRIWECLPDLIILDPAMGNMRGLELCRQLRAHPETDHIPIVLHTTGAAPEKDWLV